jgi:CopG antitoxin of type II toxin-antitoxin system
MSTKTISAEEFDRMFDDGEDIDAYIDWSSARRPGLEIKRVNIDFPQWMVDRLDREAKRRGVTRQSLIKMWISDELDMRAARARSKAVVSPPALDQAA